MTTINYAQGLVDAERLVCWMLENERSFVIRGRLSSVSDHLRRAAHSEFAAHFDGLRDAETYHVAPVYSQDFT